MAIIKGLERTFNTVYTEYDRWRPTYVPQLYKDIFAAKEISQSSQVLEIGIGTGQATLPILSKGCSLTAVELGSNLAKYTKKKFNMYENFTVRNMAFQDYECEMETFDLIYSASAFHWIPEEVGYTKVFNLLKSGGVFARFANHPFKDKGREAIHLAMQKIYNVYMPGALESLEYGDEKAKLRSEIGANYGFTDISYKLYHRKRSFSAKEYVALLGTYSDHIALEENKRIQFFAEIQNVIEELGDQITLYDTIDLQLSIKP